MMQRHYGKVEEVVDIRSKQNALCFGIASLYVQLILISSDA